MSSERFGQLYAVLKAPLSRKILLELGDHDSLTFEELVGNLKLFNPPELSSQLRILEELTVDGQPLLLGQSSPENQVKQYMLTQKGHDILIDLIDTEIESENFEQTINKKGRSYRRYIYIMFGTVLGTIAWFFFLWAANTTGFRWTFSDSGFNLLLLLLLFACWAIGGLIGSFLGKELNYRLPMFRV
jgi:hypothetical protein